MEPLSLETRLERGEVIHLPQCPIALPTGDDLAFLLRQQLAGRRYKNISYDPRRDRVVGHRASGADSTERLRLLIDDFSRRATQWLASALPRYATGWTRDRASLRPAEEATRLLRIHARNDLLHVDAFPTRPTGGARILRIFANINPTDPRVWVTSDTFPRLLERFGQRVGLPTSGGESWKSRVGRTVLGLFHPQAQRTPYDDFMLRLHHYLKRDDSFQEKGPRRFWHFAPGSAWLAFTDGVSHAVLRGQFALEQTLIVPTASLLDPASAPVTLLQRACGLPVDRLAA